MTSVRQSGLMIVAVMVGLFAFIYIAWRPTPSGMTRVPLAAPSTQAGGSDASDWPNEGGNVGRTRAVDAVIDLPIVPRTQIRLSGRPESGSPPAIAAGMLLVEAKDQLNAYDLRSGEAQWAFKLRGTYISPAIFGDTVYIRIEAKNEGELEALDLKTGVKRWAFKPRELSSSANNYFGGHLGSPVEAGGIVYLAAGKSLYALDAKTGATRWEYATKDYVTSSATVSGDRVYISDFKQFYAIDRQRGIKLWSYDTNDSVYFAAVAAGDAVAITNGDRVNYLDASSGARRWELTIPGEKLIPAALKDGVLYVKSTAVLFAIDAVSGTQRWRYSETNFVSLPILTRDKIFLISGMGADAALHALDPQTGASSWKYADRSLSTTAPVIAGETIYVRTNDGRVLGLWR